MTKGSFRALVVDDDPAVRQLTIHALAKEGFACDAAIDGLHAKEILTSAGYDVVVTDLRMPNFNGHALAVDLLKVKERPAIVILTGVFEPRLAKDLIRRGVDCVEFKPVRYDLFAAKVKAMTDRRERDLENARIRGFLAASLGPEPAKSDWHCTFCA
ncbi:MAG: response regulator [Thermoguttaceae bacterium]